MKKYITDTRDTCWRDCIGCILGIKPERVPNFVKLYRGEFMDKTREWLREEYGMGIVYISCREFMESGSERIRRNGSIGPMGYSIGHMVLVNSGDGSDHVVICLDGEVYWDNGDDRHSEYDYILGYYVIYFLDNGGRISKRMNSIRKPDKIT